MIWQKILNFFHRKPEQESIEPGQSKEHPIRDKQAEDNTVLPPQKKADNSKIQLVIGLDFGTSFTKVVVGESRVQYAVPFGNSTPDKNTPLLPSALRVLPENGNCMLIVNGLGGEIYDNLKMPLIERNFSEDARVRSTAFLALVLKYTRNWLLNQHGSTYGNRKIEWYVNIGLPTDSFDDKELKLFYCDIVQNAWKISTTSCSVTLNKTLDMLKQADCTPTQLQQEFLDSDLQLPTERINAFPEFSAQLVGYVHSPRRQSGLHVMVDVGGGTFDLTVFNVHQVDFEDVFPIFARKVEPLGVRYLLNARLQNVTNQEYSPFDDLPSDKDFETIYGVTSNDLEDTDKSFRKNVAGAIRESLQYTKKCRYPSAPQWDPTSSRYNEPLPAFYCGGGALADFYATLLRNFEECAPPCRLQATQLPIPDTLKIPEQSSLEQASNVYNRLTVAHGLSFHPLNISEVIEMRKIGNIDPIEK